MKRTAIFFVLALLVLTSCTAMANASQVSSKNACNVTIDKFIIHPATGVAPAKIGFTTYMSGNVKSVSYQILDKSGKVVASCRSYCSHCTKKKICTCSLIIKQPGTYDAKVTAYGTGGCSVTQVNKSAITVTSAKLIPSFTSTVSGKNVTFKNASTGAAKWTWTFGDGSKSTAQNPTHTYKKAGIYKVCLTICNDESTSCESVCNKVIVK
jgi:PKD repeat protein